jgi:copper chaperone CopZ
MNLTFHIDNMKCMGCVSTVQKALNELAGCEQATVDLDAAMAEVSGNVDSDQLVKTLTGLGYPATPMGEGRSC